MKTQEGDACRQNRQKPLVPSSQNQDLVPPTCREGTSSPEAGAERVRGGAGLQSTHSASPGTHRAGHEKGPLASGGLGFLHSVTQGQSTRRSRGLWQSQGGSGQDGVSAGPSGVTLLLALLQKGRGTELLLLFGWGLAWRPIAARVRGSPLLGS